MLLVGNRGWVTGHSKRATPCYPQSQGGLGRIMPTDVGHKAAYASMKGAVVRNIPMQRHHPTRQPEAGEASAGENRCSWFRSDPRGKLPLAGPEKVRTNEKGR